MASAENSNATPLAGDHAFCDTAGRRFVFSVNLFTVAKTKKATGIDLMTVVEGESGSFESLVSDWEVLLEVVCVLLEDQFDRMAIGVQEFGESMNEQTCNDAVEALMFSIIDFFQPAKAAILRRAFAKVWSKTADHQASQLQKAGQMVDGPEFDQAISKELAKE